MRGFFFISSLLQFAFPNSALAKDIWKGQSYHVCEAVLGVLREPRNTFEVLNGMRDELTREALQSLDLFKGHLLKGRKAKPEFAELVVDSRTASPEALKQAADHLEAIKQFSELHFPDKEDRNYEGISEEGIQNQLESTIRRNNFALEEKRINENLRRQEEKWNKVFAKYGLSPLEPPQIKFDFYRENQILGKVFKGSQAVRNAFDQIEQHMLVIGRILQEHTYPENDDLKKHISKMHLLQNKYMITGFVFLGFFSWNFPVYQLLETPPSIADLLSIIAPNLILAQISLSLFKNALHIESAQNKVQNPNLFPLYQSLQRQALQEKKSLFYLDAWEMRFDPRLLHNLLILHRDGVVEGTTLSKRLVEVIHNIESQSLGPTEPPFTEGGSLWIHRLLEVDAEGNPTLTLTAHVSFDDQPSISLSRSNKKKRKRKKNLEDGKEPTEWMPGDLVPVR